MAGFLAGIGGLSGVGSALSGAGSLASAFGFGGGSKSPVHGLDEALDAQRKLQNKQARELPAEMVKGWLKAGIHPLAGLGVPLSSPTSGFTPVTGDISKDLGQNISRAGKALQDIGNRTYQKKVEDLTLERMQLENDLLRGQKTTIHNATNPAIGHGTDYTVDGQGNSRVVGSEGVDIKKHQVISKAKKDRGLAAGHPPAMVKYDLGSGQSIELPFSEEGPSESIENLPLGLKQLKTLEMYWKRHTKSKSPGHYMAKRTRKLKKKFSKKGY
ncbi:hypothetical protein [Eel River basin pequenovirus]|nr:hypothetical protein [Eel River basin pequenovirus]